MQDAIQQILNGIPKGHIFDSHFVIARLIKFHSDAYLEFTGNINATSNLTLVGHGRIGKEIARFEQPGIISREGLLPSHSENIHGNASKCTCWVKV